MRHAADLALPKYRADIDGLRAIGVLAVVLFHAFRDWFPGGFVGVDIFFVVSGFLISTIILENLERKTFSFREFYLRRIRRILPALAVIVATAFALGLYSLMSGALGAPEFQRLEKNILAGAAFVSNFILWRESGYFELSPAQQPLLHLWSLAIEEQFYVIWPLVLWLCWFRRASIFWLLLLAGIASLGWSTWLTITDPVAAFYSPLSRFYELLIGALLAHLRLFHGDRLAKVTANKESLLSLAGAVLVLSAFLFTKPSSPFPGYFALLPTVGTALLILAGPRAWLNARVLSNSALVGVGLISYPLYLWHWPLLSFASLLNIGADPLARLCVVAISAFLAWATYAFIERPIRFRDQSKISGGVSVRLVSGFAFAFLLAVVLTDFITQGLTPATSLENISLPREQKVLVAKLQSAASVFKLHEAGEYDGPCMRVKQGDTEEFFVKGECLKIRNPGKPTVLLLGDSFAGSLGVGLRPFVEKRGMNFLQVTSGWCEPTTTDTADASCRKINDMVLSSLPRLQPDLVIVQSHWMAASSAPYIAQGADFRQALFNLIDRLKAGGAKRIIVVGQVPTWTAALPDILRQAFVMQGKPIPERTFAGIEPISIKADGMMQGWPYPEGVTYASALALLCNNQGCLTSIGPDPEHDLVAFDYGHFPKHAAEYVSEHLLGGFIAEINRAGP